MSKQRKPILHARDHGPGGADPLSSSGQPAGQTIVSDGSGGIEWGAGGGGGGPSSLIAFWSGLLPPITGVGQTVVVPSDPDDGPLDFSITILRARVDSPSASVPVEFRIQHSAGGGAFTGSTVGDVTVAASTYEAETTGLSFAVSSGELLRITYLAVGPLSNYYVHVLANIV